jgi:thiol-disulfide isomerase/thioredoxin
LASGKATLTYANQSGVDTTLSATITGGSFTFAGSLPEPELARLNITEGWPYSLNFFLENANVSMSLVKDAAWKTSITGSTSEVIYEKLKPGLNEFFEHARQNEAAHHQGNADSIWKMQQHQWIENIRATITTNADNYAALHFIKWLLFKPDNLDGIYSLFMQLGARVRNGAAGKKFLSEFEHLHRTYPGQPAPEISGKDTSGHAMSLAALKGKVVLLDFWSSYCGPCRQENKRMMAVYQKYHPQGFEMLSFSLDNDRNMWLSAIRNDSMSWPQASDLRGGAGATAGIYDITELPRNVLIDRNGKIYAKDLHGDELIKAMENLLKK